MINCELSPYYIWIYLRKIYDLIDNDKYVGYNFKLVIQDGVKMKTDAFIIIRKRYALIFLMVLFIVAYTQSL